MKRGKLRGYNCCDNIKVLYSNIFLQPLPKIKDWIENDMGEDNINNLKELHKLFDLAGFNEEERNIYFKTIRWERRKEKIDYSKKPIKEKKDNKDFYNGGGGSNKNKIRYPKKCRKTAWKRFAKLFPNAVKIKNGKITKK